MTAGVELDWGLRNQEIDKMRAALAQVVDWWDCLKAIIEGSDRSISFGASYEPSWLKAARDALDR